ncbi:Hypothetical protein Tpal_2362 [Trichococcus palustris]|uniref:Uncharacterized protein n=1 Tax=Trichococcus palustris TaxID=140314 RepID=A0A143YV08_9LACT|nr:Hypothetical protein Tpal_2362 [Trichococcus palustris]SFK87798.1 hypothetical protein SAMN04488076_10776 [Trichococcus palustris]
MPTEPPGCEFHMMNAFSAMRSMHIHELFCILKIKRFTWSALQSVYFYLWATKSTLIEVIVMLV